MRGDGKDKFYRTLHLDKESKKALEEFKKFKKEVLKDHKKDKENQNMKGE